MAFRTNQPISEIPAVQGFLEFWSDLKPRQGSLNHLRLYAPLLLMLLTLAIALPPLLAEEFPGHT